MTNETAKELFAHARRTGAGVAVAHVKGRCKVTISTPECVFSFVNDNQDAAYLDALATLRELPDAPVVKCRMPAEVKQAPPERVVERRETVVRAESDTVTDVVKTAAGVGLGVLGAGWLLGDD